MRFNYFKELISSALLYALCVKGCKETKFFASKCVPNANGQIIELELKNNAVVKAGYLSSLTSIEKLTISGEQKFIQQYHFNEIATSTTLKEIHLTYTSVSSSNIDMTVLKKNVNLYYLEVSESCAKHIKFNEMTNIRELNISKVSVTQKMMDEIVKIPKLSKMSICLDSKFNKLDIKGLKSKKTLTSIEFNYKESSSAKYIDFKNSFKGFTNVKELKLNYVKLTETDIKDISGLSQIQSITLNECNFSHSSIQPLNNLGNLNTFELKEAKDIKGETLTNKSLIKAEYGISSSSSNNFCMNSNSKGIKDAHRKSLKPCSAASAASYNAHAAAASSHGSHNAHASSFFNPYDRNKNIKISTNGKCGHKYGKCPNNQCCNKNNRCGRSIDYCGYGCQSEFGRCNFK